MKANKTKLEQQFCVEGDGNKATHLHGNKHGLEPCCGQHDDCDEDDEDAVMPNNTKLGEGSTPGPWTVAYGRVQTANTKEVIIAKMDRVQTADDAHG